MAKITVCIGSSCHLKGSRKVVEELQYLVKTNKLDDDVELGGAFCMGKCGAEGVSVPAKVTEFFDDVVVKAVNEEKKA